MILQRRRIIVVLMLLVFVISVAIAANTAVTVYITDTGKKYHRDNCRYLKNGKTAISLTEAKSKGYTPCKVCKPPK